jgi:type I restriction enzyme R subunit
MTTDTSEKGLEGLIVRSMTGRVDLLSPPYVANETSTPVAGGTGWILGDPKHYDRGACVDLVQLRGFLMATQPELVDKLSLETDTPTRRQFLARLEKEVGKRGVIDVLRKGVDHGPLHVDLFYGTPSPGNDKAAERFACNRFSVTRQLAYSRDESRRALDLGLFINGLPIATFELKNSLTKQTVEDAVEQYRRDRDPREPLFAFGRCVVHFAVDDSEVRFCTELKGKGSWFLPFNKGYCDGAGNPPNPNGLKTSYLWEEVLTPRGLTDILENYAQIVEETDRRSGKKKQKQVFPRFHQLDVVRKLLADAREVGAGRRYLIQHSAGSGKSNSIAWLAHQLIAVKQSDGKDTFDSIIVVTDRRILDEQIQANIKQFAQVSAVVGAVTGSGASKTQQLSKFLESGKKIIISTVQTFPFLLKEIGDAHRGRRFAIIIDEAHSSQGGKTASAMSEALAEAATTTPRTSSTMSCSAAWTRARCSPTRATSRSRRRPRTRRSRSSATPCRPTPKARSSTGRSTATR